MSGIKYMHNYNILHRDIKLENVVIVRKISKDSLNDIEIKIIDFGISVDLNKYKSNKNDDLLGTIMYMSPESMNGSVVLPWDIWSCGIICYMLATKKMPYLYRSEDELMDKVSRAEIIRKSIVSII